MRAWILVYYFIVACYGYSSSGALGTVHDDSFKEVVVDSGKWVFVDFYADWCRHCKKLTPEVERVAHAFADYSDIFAAVKINGDTDGKRMLKKYVLVGYPTMLMFHGADEPIEYDGARDWQSISNFVQQLTNIRLEKDGAVSEPDMGAEDVQAPTAIPELNATTFDEHVLGPASNRSVILFSASWCHACSAFKDVFEALAHNVYASERSLGFAKVSLETEGNGDLAEKYGVETLPSIRFVENGQVVACTCKRDLDTLVHAINQHFGLCRDRDGALLPHAGRIEYLDVILADAFETGLTIQEAGARIVEACVSARSSGAPLLQYYLRLGYMLQLGEARLLRAELTRLHTILQNDHEKIDGDVVDSMHHRRNILTQFAHYL